MTFQIRKQIVLPARTRTVNPNAGQSKYPVADLGIGDGFFIPGAKKSAGVTMSKLGKKYNVKLETRRGKDFASYDEAGNGVGEPVDGLFVKRVEATEA